MSNSNLYEEHAGAEIAAALQAMPRKSAPEGSWKRVMEHYAAGQQTQLHRRRYWGGGLAIAASLAVAVVGLRLGGGMFSEMPAADGGVDTERAGSFANDSTADENRAAGGTVTLEEQLAHMDMDALIALSRFQEQRLRALPVSGLSHPGRVVEVDAFGLATELEDQIALLDEGMIPASVNLDDQSVPRRLFQERAMLMDDLFSLRRAEAAQAGFMYADL